MKDVIDRRSVDVLTAHWSVFYSLLFNIFIFIHHNGSTESNNNNNAIHNSNNTINNNNLKTEIYYPYILAITVADYFWGVSKPYMSSVPEKLLLVDIEHAGTWHA